MQAALSIWHIESASSRSILSSGRMAVSPCPSLDPSSEQLLLSRKDSHSPRSLAFMITQRCATSIMLSWVTGTSCTPTTCSAVVQSPTAVSKEWFNALRTETASVAENAAHDMWKLHSSGCDGRAREEVVSLRGGCRHPAEVQTAPTRLQPKLYERLWQC